MGRISVLKDFRKKRTKVGHKARSVNETKVKLKATQIYVVDQTKNEEETDQVKRIQKQLKIVNTGVRIAAISSLRSMIESNHEAMNPIILLFPHFMELLFDEDADVRSSLVDLLSSFSMQLSSNFFLSIMPVLVSSVCSALNHFNKVRFISNKFAVLWLYVG
jgi:hypothetical protein